MTRTAANPSQAQQRQTQPAPAAQKPAGNGKQPEKTREEIEAELLDQVLGKPINYTPLGETETLEIRWSMVNRLLVRPTKKGFMPSEADVYTFIMVCKQRQLNPFAGDCWLVGYDTNDGPVFNTIVAVQALFKRADVAKTAAGEPAFEGIQSGVITTSGDEVIEREGDLVYDGEKLIGGWAKVYRNDRRLPFYQRLKLSSYDKKRSMWNSDPAGQIVKCAEAASLRQAFPSDVGGLYLAGEMDRISDDHAKQDPAKSSMASAAQALKDRMLPPAKTAADKVVGNAPAAQDATQDRQEAPGEHDQTEGAQGREPGDDEGEPLPGAEAAVESASQPVMFGGK